MGKILATYAITLTLRAPDGMTDEEADAVPTVGPASAIDIPGAVFPGIEILVDMLGETVSLATQLSANATAHRTDK